MWQEMMRTGAWSQQDGESPGSTPSSVPEASNLGLAVVGQAVSCVSQYSPFCLSQAEQGLSLAPNSPGSLRMGLAAPLFRSEDLLWGF